MMTVYYFINYPVSVYLTKIQKETYPIKRSQQYCPSVLYRIHRVLSNLNKITEKIDLLQTYN